VLGASGATRLSFNGPGLFEHSASGDGEALPQVVQLGGGAAQLVQLF